MKRGEKFIFPLANEDLKQPGPPLKTLLKKRTIMREDADDEEFPDKGESEDQGGEEDAAAEESASREAVPEGEDFWSLNEYNLTRHHVTPRTTLFTFW